MEKAEQMMIVLQGMVMESVDANNRTDVKRYEKIMEQVRRTIQAYIISSYKDGQRDMAKRITRLIEEHKL